MDPETQVKFMLGVTLALSAGGIYFLDRQTKKRHENNFAGLEERLHPDATHPFNEPLYDDIKAQMGEKRGRALVLSYQKSMGQAALLHAMGFEVDVAYDSRAPFAEQVTGDCIDFRIGGDLIDLATQKVEGPYDLFLASTIVDRTISERNRALKVHKAQLVHKAKLADSGSEDEQWDRQRMTEARQEAVRKYDEVYAHVLDGEIPFYFISYGDRFGLEFGGEHSELFLLHPEQVPVGTDALYRATPEGVDRIARVFNEIVEAQRALDEKGPEEIGSWY